MNERIRQLAELADEYTDNKIQMPGEYHPDWHDVRDEKFAKLIVEECIKEAGKDENGPAYEAVARIARHFGVE
ncbi:hypothetical protein UFOVP1146_185 [uncultured Caudovirales phage]|uniref:Uncharacterized protein n=1 Tax=uncultured Caudovirales phage TaxID=2100421 RepID=A0A6J5NWG7_9CAUD|nr:hypothetical protein UFOVP812_98 [uncultured Caudovirales phage]CAB4165491.1 hypothetical protein UFOVP818_45 [uncultured Caudovirales phage]CAB4186839.1 hypothetical protein UFOVP1146_185 [uncultured Caudovirales phage]CAB4221557.1 hypothetical protein UFOVP1638_380 [uncultured Caudovirales phage]